METAELKNALREIIPLENGGSFKLLWDMLYHIRLLKYVRQSNLKAINPRYSKICSTKKLDRLVELGLLSNANKDVFTATDAAVALLRGLKYNTKTLPRTISGDGLTNELNNTEVFIQALKLPDYKALLYPVFADQDKTYLRPDALLVRANDRKYKLEFLEIEASKSGWNDWLENKRINYLKLAKDRQAYAYWKAQCSYLEMPFPDIKDFTFSVIFICKLKNDFGQGFNFQEKL
jgi:hypothetical protein